MWMDVDEQSMYTSEKMDLINDGCGYGCGCEAVRDSR